MQRKLILKKLEFLVLFLVFTLTVIACNTVVIEVDWRLQDMPVDVWEKVLENPPAPLTEVSEPRHCGIHASILKNVLMSCYADCFTQVLQSNIW